MNSWRTRLGHPADRGSMAVEVVILAPLLVAFMVAIVAFGKYADTRGQVAAVARDAVRAATLERDAVAARNAAQGIATAAAPSYANCDPIDPLWGNQAGDPLVFAPGAIITVELVCHVSLNDLGLISLPGNVTVTGVSSAPLDVIRRVTP